MSRIINEPNRSLFLALSYHRAVLSFKDKTGRKWAYLAPLDLVLLFLLFGLDSPCTFGYLRKNSGLLLAHQVRADNLSKSLLRLGSRNLLVNNPSGNRSNYKITLQGRSLVVDIDKKIAKMAEGF